MFLNNLVKNLASIFFNSKMTKPWISEIDFQPKDAGQIIAKDFPALDIHSVREFGSGWDNSAFLVNEELVFRFTRRKYAAQFAVNEQIALPLLKDKLPLVTPDLIYTGTFGPESWPYSGYPKLPGTQLCDAELSIDARLRVAAQLADFLKSLHALDPDVFARAKLPHDTLARLECHERGGKALELLGRLEKSGHLKHFPNLRKIIVEAQNLMVRGKKVLLHGDLYTKHILVNEDGGVSGIIDWGDCHIGYIETDINVLHLILPPNLHDVFFSIYGNVEGDVWQISRFRALTHCLNSLEYALDVGDKAMILDAKLSLEWIAGVI